jgi:hypothetical protein
VLFFLFCFKSIHTTTTWICTKQNKTLVVGGWGVLLVHKGGVHSRRARTRRLLRTCLYYAGWWMAGVRGGGSGRLTEVLESFSFPSFFGSPSEHRVIAPFDRLLGFLRPTMKKKVRSFGFCSNRRKTKTPSPFVTQKKKREKKRILSNGCIVSWYAVRCC